MTVALYTPVFVAVTGLALVTVIIALVALGRRPLTPRRELASGLLLLVAALHAALIALSQLRSTAGRPILDDEPPGQSTTEWRPGP